MNDEYDNTDDDTNCEEVTNTVKSSVVDQNDVNAELVKGLRDGSVGRAVHVDNHATYGQTVGSDQVVHVNKPNWLDEGYKGPDYPDDIFGAQNKRCPI